MEEKLMFQTLAWRAKTMFVPKLGVTSDPNIYAATSSTFEQSTCLTSFHGSVIVVQDLSGSMIASSMNSTVRVARKPITRE